MVGEFRGTNPASAANDAKIAAEQEQCYDLRLEGLSIREVARKTGLSRSTVQNRLNDESIRRIAPRSDALRIQQLDQLDEINSRLQREKDAIHVGDKPDSVVKLSNSQLGVIDRAARLMGTNAPEKVAVTTNRDSLDLPPALAGAMRAAELDAERREAEIRARGNGA